jgi:hypothetical protein
MNALTMSNTLIELGMNKEQPDFIARAIEEKNNEIVTKGDIQQIIKHTNTMVFGLGAVTITGFGFIYTLLNTIITKLN